MPTLSAMFKLMDGYSSQINKIIDRTDRAMAKMLGASKAADKVNDSLGKTGKKSREILPLKTFLFGIRMEKSMCWNILISMCLQGLMWLL